MRFCILRGYQRWLYIMSGQPDVLRSPYGGRHLRPQAGAGLDLLLVEQYLIPVSGCAYIDPMPSRAVRLNARRPIQEWAAEG